MSTTTWTGGDLALMALCIVAGLLALGFFISIFIADARDAKRRVAARKAIQRARKHFGNS